MNLACSLLLVRPAERRGLSALGEKNWSVLEAALDVDLVLLVVFEPSMPPKGSNSTSFQVSARWG